MRDPGLSEAIQAVGGVSELARRIGISQPSVSNWDKVPAERVLAVEAATGVARMRAAARPLSRDAEPATSTRSISRARRNTRCSPPCWRARPTRDCCSGSRASRGDASPLGLAHVALGEAAARTRCERGRARVFRSLHRARARRAAALRLLLSHRLPATSVRSRGCATISRRSASSASKATTSRKITPRPCARSWRRSPADASPAPRRRRAQVCSRSTWRRGSAASSPISSAPKRPTSTAHVGALGRVFIEIENEAFALPA